MHSDGSYLDSINRDVRDELGLVDTKYTNQGFPPGYFKPETFRLSVVGEQYNLANQLLYYPILTFVRASIVIFILRLGGLRKYVVRSLRILFVINFCLVIAFFFADLFQCRPVRYAWDSDEMDRKAQEAAGADENGMKDGKLIKGGKCIGGKQFFVSLAALSIFLDLWLLSIPSAIVWGINMPRRQKCMVVGVLSIGVVVTVFSIARVIVAADNFDLSYLERTHNIEYTLSNIETNCAIWAAAIPALKSLIARISPRWWQTATKPSSPYPNTPNLPHASGFHSPIPPLVGSGKGSQYFPRAASNSDPQPYPLGALSPSRRIDHSEVELRRFEYDPRVSSLFRTGKNCIPEDHSSERTISMRPESSNRQASPDPKMTPRNGSPFGSKQNEEGQSLPLSPPPATSVQNAEISSSNSQDMQENRGLSERRE
ncbi:hypothetical protein EMCG_06343 [[Emmonsia] crescens]|uniref:Rhodopsin domain-containing protein n=1 Tax=[Emmonsia] crescens TaxID=73230 RepID=A0A0G2JBS7_9EURO|nr:hypothetical protein EMCG_06343 [Emmonsia crescens UAMH 3008]